MIVLIPTIDRYIDYILLKFVYSFMVHDFCVFSSSSLKVPYSTLFVSSD